MDVSNNSIQCHVHNCKFNSTEHCTLNSIVVGQTTASIANTQADTECDSFQMQ